VLHKLLSALHVKTHKAARYLSKSPATTSKHFSRNMLYTTEGHFSAAIMHFVLVHNKAFLKSAASPKKELFSDSSAPVSCNTNLLISRKAFDEPSIVVADLLSIFAHCRKPLHAISINRVTFGLLLFWRWHFLQKTTPERNGTNYIVQMDALFQESKNDPTWRKTIYMVMNHAGIRCSKRYQNIIKDQET